MPRLQTFDGDDLDALLARVRSEAGPNARVLEAKKVRDGGLGGFFSRERFVLTVEIGDAPAERRTTRAPRPPRAEMPVEPTRHVLGMFDRGDAVPVAPPSSILELADMVDDVEGREHAVVPRPHVRPAVDPLAPPAPPRPAPLDWAALDAPRYEPERVVQVPAVRVPDPMPSTESDSFQDVLRRLAAEIPAEPAPAPVDVPEMVEFETLDLTTLDLGSLAGPLEEPAATIEPEIDLVEEIAADVVIDVEAEADDEPEVDEPAIDETDALPAVRPNPALLRVRRVPTAFERTIGLGLLELGVPAAYVPDLEGTFSRDDVRAAIVTALRLPRPPALPVRNNAIVAIVGERRAAINLADQLADEPALNGAIVKVADRQGFTLLDGGSPGADGAGRRTRPTRTVVVVPSSPGMHSSWTRELLDHLEPDMVWGVVPAARKSEDVAAWAIEMGGFDVLALTGVAKTVSPATSLRLGIPIGLIDGECATTEAWADLLTARLAA